MTTTPEDGARVYARTHPNHWINISAEDIPTGWIDDMVKRLFEELNRQMIRIERTSMQMSDKKNDKNEYDDKPEEREQHARTLARIQTQLERLTEMEMKRASLRKTKKSHKPKETRADVYGRLMGTTEPGRAPKRTGEAQ
ncbi:MAG TPA: hypothetical protein VHZ78_01970 [Rhizomicrobium sp.]|jgi:hypothetical protein|nr:hypothetical protein [Rhizomicrobium sp.]